MKKYKLDSIEVGFLTIHVDCRDTDRFEAIVNSIDVLIWCCNENYNFTVQKGALFKWDVLLAKLRETMAKYEFEEIKS